MPYNPPLNQRAPIFVVYAITQISTGKQYIGVTKNFSRRAIDHRSHLRKGKHKSKNLQQACNDDPLGVDGFTFTALEETTADKRYERERAWIAEYKPDFNCIGVTPPSQEWRERISATKKGIPKSQASIEKRLQTIKARGPIRLSDETRKKLSASKKGKPMPPRSPVHAENISKALRGRKQSVERKRAALIGQLRHFGHSEEAISQRLKELYG